MPLYDFRCRSCNTQFEEFVPLSVKGGPACPECGKGNSEKLISAVGIMGGGGNSGKGRCGARGGFT
ncbi:MAG: hypothetical protein A2293_15355 [Elusimicrobia bacterium RIFOXYB2_FULL_49_7]|nr:MAG: hypothetical protein A2293_15355 [Elusimicrobia bacterium RIFOXYB2_FULL_49_7]